MSSWGAPAPHRISRLRMPSCFALVASVSRFTAYSKAIHNSPYPGQIMICLSLDKSSSSSPAVVRGCAGSAQYIYLHSKDPTHETYADFYASHPATGARSYKIGNRSALKYLDRESALKYLDRDEVGIDYLSAVCDSLDPRGLIPKRRRCAVIYSC